MVARIAATAPGKAIRPIVALVDEPPAKATIAFKRTREVTRSATLSDHRDAARMHDITEKLIADLDAGPG